MYLELHKYGKQFSQKRLVEIFSQGLVKIMQQCYYVALLLKI